MVMDALRGYVQLASGLTEVTRQRAQQAAKQLLQQTGAENLTTGLTGKVSELADEIVATSKSNRALLQAIITNEVEGAVARLGFVRAEEVAALRRRLEKVEQQTGVNGEPAKKAAAKKAAKKAPAKKAAAKKAAKKTAAKKA
jgi:polyhydroxyalkanoate synthesis regulator phasin